MTVLATVNEVNNHAQDKPRGEKFQRVGGELRKYVETGEKTERRDQPHGGTDETPFYIGIAFAQNQQPAA